MAMTKDEFLEAIKGMNVLELSDLVKALGGRVRHHRGGARSGGCSSWCGGSAGGPGRRSRGSGRAERVRGDHPGELGPTRST